MRKIASIKQPKDEAKRVMLFDSGEGVYLFLYNSEQDGASTGDYWFETVEQAEESCTEDYGITPLDWQTIPDPLPGCQHDWIQPTRVRRDSAGKPLYGQFEPYSNEPTNAYHALQQTRPSRSDCNPRLPQSGSLSLGRFGQEAELVSRDTPQ